MHAIRFGPEHLGAWDSFVQSADDGHFLQSRRFLSYHGSRFSDVSAVIAADARGSRILGVFPAAVSPLDSSVAISHPGSTFGGLVHDNRLEGGAMVQALERLQEAYRDWGFKQLQVKLSPDFYPRHSTAEFEYALWRVGAQLDVSALSSTIMLTEARIVGKNLDRERRAAAKAVRVKRTSTPSPEFWDLLTHTLGERHSALPTHSWTEIARLCELFPADICTYEAQGTDRVVAGAVVFMHPIAWHTQYLAVSAEGRQLFALYAVIERAIADASAAGARVFDFGISTSRDGRVLNAGLHQFKQKFGAGSSLYRQYVLTLI